MKAFRKAVKDAPGMLRLAEVDDKVALIEDENMDESEDESEDGDS